MDLENKRLYNWLPWLIALAVSGLFVGLLSNELSRHSADWLQHLRVQQDIARDALGVSGQSTQNEAAELAQLIAQDPQVVALVREAYQLHKQEKDLKDEQSVAVRAHLNQVLQHWWTRMSPHNLRELNIHLGPDASVFLRVNKLDRFGDDLRLISPLVVTTLKAGIATKGMEVQHYGAAYRAIEPITSSDTSTETIAVVEVALPLVTASNKDDLTHPQPDAQGQAVLLHSTLINEVLWASARQEILTNAKGLHNAWLVETYSNAIVLDWQAKGLLADPFKRAEPWIIKDHEKSYLLTLLYPGDHGPTRASQKIFVVHWSDISLEQNAHNVEYEHIVLRYLGGWMLAEFILWILFRFNRRHVLQLLREHSKQLQKERDLSEQARQRLTLALQSSESGFWEWDITHNRALFSKEWRELCGLPGEDGRGDIEEWLGRVHPSDKRTSYNEMIRHIKGETPMFENEYRLKIADGSFKWIFTRGKVVEWTADGKASLMLGVYTDITERKKNEIIVIRQQAALRALNEIASIPVFDAEDQLRRALVVGARYLGLPSGVVSRIQGNQYQIKIKVGQGIAPAQDHIDALSNYFCELTLRNEDVFCCDEIAQSDYVDHFAYQQKNVESYIGVPIWLKGKVYGTLCFASGRSRHQDYDDLDKDFMRLLARWVGVTLERWQHQSEQQALLDRFDKLCNQLPGFLYQFQLFPDGSSLCPYASDGIFDLYCVTPAEVMGSAEKLFERLHPDDFGWISQTISQSAATLVPWIASFRVIHPVRGEIWVRAESRPEKLPDDSVLWHGFIIDITEEKQAELKLQEVNSLREAIFDAASISIISTNVQGLIKTFNAGAESLLGYSAQEVVDKMSPGIFHLADEVVARAGILSREFGEYVEPGFDVFTMRARAGDEDEQEWIYVRKDGSHVPVMLSIAALRNPDGEITGYLGVARDISEIKRIDRMKSEFISTVSHELRTPLTAISGALGIVVNGAAGAVPDTANKMLNIAHKNSLRLIHLVNDLLDMEKLVAGKMHFDISAQPIVPIIQQSLEANAIYAAQYNVKFSLVNLTSEDFRISVDAQRLLQVLANYLSNAAKFSPPYETVEVQVEQNFNNVRISVIDKGPGIPDEFRSRIFQKFSQADSSSTREKGGTGLGLAICKEIIERMGGRVGFISEVGKGSAFYFELPCEELSHSFGSRHEPRVPTGERLLVVEDDPEVAELFATMLRANNYRVDLCYSGQQALERMALYAYQCITVDIELPDMNGIDLIKQLRMDASTQRLPVVVITANLDSARAENRENPLFANVQWLQKPQTTNSLVAAVQKVLAK